jgi:hypothetical protein
MWDYFAQTKGREAVSNSNRVHADGNMPLLFSNALRHSFKKENKERGSNTTNTIATPHVSRRPRKNLHQAAKGMPTLANGLVGEVLNESPNFQGYNQCGISRHTNNGEMKY